MSERNLELYKKYRALKWSQLIGQQKTAQTIVNALKSNKLPTAYFFSGPRGVGKTSSAWLLSKAVNCERNRDENNVVTDPNPCNKCDTCVSIDDNAQPGVHYISMANAGSVEHVRELMKNAYTSSAVRRQVFILDEAHNLSRAAFDALLIPIESASMPSLFIFCSTAREKVPATVLGRMQARNFQLVESNTMYKYISKIAQVEELDVNKEQLIEAVKLGRGSVRDTLSVLDEIAISGELETSIAYDEKIVESIAQSQFHQALTYVAEAHKDGADFKILTENIFRILSDMVILASGGDKSLITANGIENPEEIAKIMSYPVIIRSLEHLGTALNSVAMGGDARIYLEIALTKILMTLKHKK